MSNAPEDKKVVAIVQARLGSSRLPLKSLLCLRGKPVIDWVAHRLSRSAAISDVVVAIPDTPIDDILAEHLEREGINCFRGPENDVLARFDLAAKASGAGLVVRVCADNPLVSGEAIDQLVAFYKANAYDYAYNHVPRGNLWPDGLGAEIVSADTLAEMARRASTPGQREHCMNYILENPHHYRIGTFDPVESWLRRPDIKLDIDNVEDYRRLAALPLSPESGPGAIIAAWDGAGAGPVS